MFRKSWLAMCVATVFTTSVFAGDCDPATIKNGEAQNQYPVEFTGFIGSFVLDQAKSKKNCPFKVKICAGQRSVPYYDVNGDEYSENRNHLLFQGMDQNGNTKEVAAFSADYKRPYFGGNYSFKKNEFTTVLTKGPLPHSDIPVYENDTRTLKTSGDGEQLEYRTKNDSSWGKDKTCRYNRAPDDKTSAAFETGGDPVRKKEVQSGARH